MRLNKDIDHLESDVFKNAVAFPQEETPEQHAFENAYLPKLREVLRENLNGSHDGRFVVNSLAWNEYGQVFEITYEGRFTFLPGVYGDVKLTVNAIDPHQPIRPQIEKLNSLVEELSAYTKWGMNDDALYAKAVFRGIEQRWETRIAGLEAKEAEKAEKEASVQS